MLAGGYFLWGGYMVPAGPQGHCSLIKAVAQALARRLGNHSSKVRKVPEERQGSLSSVMT